MILLLHADERERDDGAGRFAYVGEQRRCVEVALLNGAKETGGHLLGVSAACPWLGVNTVPASKYDTMGRLIRNPNTTGCHTGRAPTSRSRGGQLPVPSRESVGDGRRSRNPPQPPRRPVNRWRADSPSGACFPYLLRILNVDAETLTLHEHHSQEFIYVLDGEIELIAFAEERRVSEMLRAGDSCYLDSTVPHLLRGGTRNPFSQTSAEVIDVFWSPLGEGYLFGD